MTDQTDQTEDPMRALAKALFAPDEPDDPDETEQLVKPSGWVGDEGTNPQSQANDFVEWVQVLFNPEPPE
jgi:hypothetical protein